MAVEAHHSRTAPFPDSCDRGASLKMSAVLIAYSRTVELQRSLGALTAQTHPNVEIVVVLNGATAPVRDIVQQFQRKVNNIKVVSFPVNIYDLHDWPLQLRYVYRAGFEATTGDFVFFQSDDDFVANDFFARMAHLFGENEFCTTAIGLPHSHYWDSGVTESPAPGSWSLRPRFQEGWEAAVECVLRPKEFMPNPGFSYVMKRSEIMKADIFWQHFEMAHLAMVMPFGVTGFDKEAIMYWGRSETQGNVIGNNLPRHEMIKLKVHYLRQDRSNRRMATLMWRRSLEPEIVKKLAVAFRFRENHQTVYLLALSLSSLNLVQAVRVLRVGRPNVQALACWRVFAVTFIFGLPRRLRRLSRIVPSQTRQRLVARL